MAKQHEAGHPQAFFIPEATTGFLDQLHFVLVYLSPQSLPNAGSSPDHSLSQNAALSPDHSLSPAVFAAPVFSWLRLPLIVAQARSIQLVWPLALLALNF